MTAPKVNEELKPCPFCGGLWTIYIEDREGNHVRCEDCSVDGPSADTREKSIVLWNTRPSTDAEVDKCLWVRSRSAMVASEFWWGKGCSAQTENFLQNHCPDCGKEVATSEPLPKPSEVGG